MAPTNGFDDLIAEDIPRGNDGDLPGYAEPVTGTEIEELLYGDAPPAERLERLSALRGEMARLEPADFGENDPASLRGEIDDAIARLSIETGREVDLSGTVPDALIDDAVIVPADPTDHRETLAPDSDEMDLVRARDAEDIDADDDDLDEAVLAEEDEAEDDEDDLDDLEALDTDEADDDEFDEDDEDEDDVERALTAPLDETEWLDGDGFRPGRGVH
jgi:hypothetical protein